MLDQTCSSLQRWTKTEGHGSLAAVQTLGQWAGASAFGQIMDELFDTSVYLAGGAVRDALGSVNVPKDFDFFIAGHKFDDFVDRLNRQGRVEFGPFGSPRWHPQAGGAYADIISIEQFENGVGRCSNIDDVLNQFDFTANAVAIDLRSFTIHDPVGGVNDNRQGIMRCIRYDFPDEKIGPEETLTRNEVLWIRIMHYAATLHLRPEPLTRAWLAKHEKFLSAVSCFSNRFFSPLLSLDLSC